MRRHADAVAAGVPVYTDPTSGLSVFTAAFLAAAVAGVATAAAAIARSPSAADLVDGLVDRSVSSR